MALPQTGYVAMRPDLSYLLTPDSGAQIVFRSLIVPLFGRFFQGQSATTASNLKAQADKAM